MAYNKKPPADIQTHIIKVFEEQSTSFDKGGGSELRVIAWIVNGSEKQPQLERREWWMTEDGTKRAGKAKGFSASDFEFILRNAEEIGQCLNLPAKMVQQAINTKIEIAPQTSGSSTAPTGSSGGEGEGAGGSEGGGAGW